MNRLIVAPTVVVIGLFLGADDKDDFGRQKSDIVLIQGSWRVEEVRKDGKPNEEGVGDYLVFANDRLMFEPADKKEAPEQLQFELDTEASPKRLDWKFEFDGQPVTLKSIYKIEGGTLTICHGDPDQPHPKSFDAKNAFLYTLKRIPRAGQ